MGVLDRFERGVENVMQNAFARTFKSGVKPVELAAAVKRECDARAAVVDRGRTVAPNEYAIALSPADMATVDQWGADALRHELVDSLRTHAERQRYSFVGTVDVAFDTDETLATGRYAVVSRTTRGPVAPVTNSNQGSRYPLIDIDGTRYYLTGEATTLGRGSESDIVVDDSGVSRRHVRLEVTDHGTILTDLGSTNGTFIEDQRVSEATLLDGNAITIGRTTIMYWDAVAGDEDL
ncbi:FhaA domain-containing protein [Demequina soli]|uniref:FhaA domain-containing protein n=1 Tax=Demequina soli TaxID=1638987 RepID=UPI00078214AD|nr:DUF3662 and FHA domain-containing protein [Demequina soli]